MYAYDINIGDEMSEDETSGDDTITKLIFNNEISLLTYDCSILSPTSKLIFKQHQIDDDNNLLFDGFFRQNPFSSSQLPNDVKQILSSYYLKERSKAELVHDIIVREGIKVDNKRKRKEKRRAIYAEIFDTLWFFGGFAILAIIILSTIFGADISGLIIVLGNDCDSTINGQNKFVSFGVEKFLLFGCILHIIWVIIVSSTVIIAIRSRQNYEMLYCLSIVLLCFLIAFNLSWSVIGFLLYTAMDANNSANKKCANMVIGWAILTILQCVIWPCVAVIMTCIPMIGAMRSA